MLKVRLSFDSGGLSNLVNKLDKALDTTEILDEATAIILNRIRQRFLEEKDPEGVPWKASKAALKRRIGGGTGTLFNTGRLFRSIQLASSTGNQRFIGSDVPYGRFHNEGIGQEKRVFLGFSTEDAEIAQKLVLKRLKGITS